MNRKDLERLKPPDTRDEGLTKETLSARYAAGRHETDETLPQGVDLVEAKIRRAVEQGEFENLPGSGKPLDLGSYFDAPEHLRVAYHMLKSAGVVPEEVRLSKEMEELRERLRSCASEEERHALRVRLAEATQRFNECIEYNRKLGKSLYWSGGLFRGCPRELGEMSPEACALDISIFIKCMDCTACSSTMAYQMHLILLRIAIAVLDCRILDMCFNIACLVLRLDGKIIAFGSRYN